MFTSRHGSKRVTALFIKPTAAAMRSYARVQAVPIPSAASASSRLRSDFVVPCATNPCGTTTPGEPVLTTRPLPSALRSVDSFTPVRRATDGIDFPSPRSRPHSLAFSGVITAPPRTGRGVKKEPEPFSAN